jgi:catechol 2,3-dioxygenase-like lactoylglutathione lyase family enzyme
MYTHVGINVTNLEESIVFYTKLFGQEPVKVREGYAKFLVEDPGLNFTLNLRNEVSGNQLNHFGIQVANSEEVLYHKRRLEEAGLQTMEEMNVTCCYAVQDKFWVTDPQGNKWEYFYPKEDSATRNGEACCTPQPSSNATSGSCGCNR